MIPLPPNYEPIGAMNGLPTSGVGYVSQFSEGPDPWPNNQIIQPNELARQMFIDRYGVPPGFPPAYYEAGDVVNGVVITAQTKSPNIRYGYCAELFSVNGIILKAMAINGVFGPENVNGEPTATEMSDASFEFPRGGEIAKTYWWELSEGGTPEKAIPVNDPSRPPGIFAVPSAHKWPIYYLNTAETPSPAPPVALPPPSEPPIPGLPDDDPLNPGTIYRPSERILETARLMKSWWFVPPGKSGRRARLNEICNYAKDVGLFPVEWITLKLESWVLTIGPGKHNRMVELANKVLAVG